MLIVGVATAPCSKVSANSPCGLALLVLGTLFRSTGGIPRSVHSTTDQASADHNALGTDKNRTFIRPRILQYEERDTRHYNMRGAEDSNERHYETCTAQQWKKAQFAYWYSSRVRCAQVDDQR